jgi:hypothetical protein
LNKPGALTEAEFGEMKKHPAYGLKVITTAQKRAGTGDDETLEMAKDIVYTHHERWDGGGYPRGLKGEEIPIPGRVMAIVDVYDALTTNRCYRPSLPHDRAVELIVNGAGTHFDPAVVDAFLRSESLLRRVVHESTDTAFVSVAAARAREAALKPQESKPSPVVIEAAVGIDGHQPQNQSRYLPSLARIVALRSVSDLDIVRSTSASATASSSARMSCARLIAAPLCALMFAANRSRKTI